MDVVHSGKSPLRLIQVRIVAGERKLDVDAVGKALEENLKAAGGGLQLETGPDSREHRRLKLDGGLSFETHGIAEVAYSPPSGCGQAFVWIHLQNNWMVLRRQIHVLLAQETSQASRQSGQ